MERWDVLIHESPARGGASAAGEQAGFSRRRRSSAGMGSRGALHSFMQFSQHKMQEEFVPNEVLRPAVLMPLLCLPGRGDA